MSPAPAEREGTLSPLGNEPSAPAFRFSAFLGVDATLASCLEQAAVLTTAEPAPILLVGEPGTGKEMLARTIHAEGARAPQPFVTLDCRAMDAKLLEAELFGYETGGMPELLGGHQGILETAGEGTLFLRRVDELPLSLQPRLFSALESRIARRIGSREGYQIRCRILASASPAIDVAVRDGRFRRDLFQQFEGAVLRLPTLRARPDQIVPMAEEHLNRFATLEGRQCTDFSDPAKSALLARRWPGNVRELKRVVLAALRKAKGDVVELFDLPFYASLATKAVTDAGPGAAVIVIPPGGRSLDDIEAEAVAATLCLTNNNKSATARILGISRPTLARKIRKYELGQSADEKEPMPADPALVTS